MKPRPRLLEECLVLDVQTLLRRGLLRPMMEESGWIALRRPNERIRFGYAVRTRDMTAPRMILQYTIVEEHRLRHPIALPIRLATQERHGVARLTACYCDMLGE